MRILGASNKKNGVKYTNVHHPTQPRMTRINSAIPVKNLTDEHLLAEHREIKRLPYQWCKSYNNSFISLAPEKFTLGKGHVLFFLDKQGFILKRYNEIHDECLKRGFKVEDYSENWKYVMSEYMKNYTPTEEERKLLVERITERIIECPKECFHYYGHEISKPFAIDMLQKF